MISEKERSDLDSKNCKNSLAGVEKFAAQNCSSILFAAEKFTSDVQKSTCTRFPGSQTFGINSRYFDCLLQGDFLSFRKVYPRVWRRMIKKPIYIVRLKQLWSIRNFR